MLRDAAEPDRLKRQPSLSVIVPARNEELSVKEGVETLLAQDYAGDLEIIAVNDRSTDRTGEILEDLRGQHPNHLRVVRVEKVPGGWIGKNYALRLGAAEARGEWLL
ncbi:MAG TPA: glycosyltransferase, partial [Rubrobacteraceae bacterium]|nr:glycosyltransferase [Rubrobacteraceae bacterium]